MVPPYVPATKAETACRNTHQHRHELMPILPQVHRRVMPAKAYCFVGLSLHGREPLPERAKAGGDTAEPTKKNWNGRTRLNPGQI